MIDRSISK